MLKYTFLLLALAGLALAAAPARAQVAVVAHPAVADGSVDTGTLVGIYSLDQTRWSDGAAVVPFDTATDAQDAFYSALGQSAGQMKKVWLRKKLSGEGQPPESLGSDAEVLQKVASTPGAVGFVSAGAADGSVKVLATL
jgi:ABC-type phosphate transport system substrate-binding protein